MQLGERQFAAGESVAVSNGDNPDMYAEIEGLYEDRNGKAHVLLQWLYKPDDVVGGRKASHGEFELFRSKHIDDNPVGMMLGHANVLNETEYQKYLNEKQKKSEDTEATKGKEKLEEQTHEEKGEPPVYFVKRFYNHIENTFTACEFEGGKVENIVDDLEEDDDDDDESSDGGGDDDEKVVVIMEELEQAGKRGKRKRETKPREPKKQPEKKRTRVIKETVPDKPKGKPGRKKKRPVEEEEDEAPKKQQEPKSKKTKVANTTPEEPPEGDGTPKKEIIDINERLQKLAGEANQAAVVKQLIVAGADPRFNKTSLQQCSIHFAAAFGRADSLRVLLDHDKDLANVVTKKNWSPLHYAVHNKHLDAVRVLLEYVADPFIKTSDGKSALDIAKSKNSVEIVDAIQQAIDRDESVAHLSEAN